MAAFRRGSSLCWTRNYRMVENTFTSGAIDRNPSVASMIPPLGEAASASFSPHSIQHSTFALKLLRLPSRPFFCALQFEMILEFAPYHRCSSPVFITLLTNICPQFPITALLFRVLLHRGLSHYAGGVFTGSPLMLAAAALCSTVPPGVRAFAATTLFAAFDVASALLLRAICVRAVAVESGDW